MKLGLGTFGAKIQANWQGLSDPAGAATRFREMAQNTSDPKLAAKYENLADQWGGTAMQGGFMAAAMNGTLGMGERDIKSGALQQMQMGEFGGEMGFAGGSPFLDTGSTASLAALAGQGYSIT